MKAVWFERQGGPEVLEIRNVPDPAPGEREVLVDVEAIGVNYRDVYEREREGYGTDAPGILGAEAGGTTADGERVAWTRVPRSYAERVAVRLDETVPIPDSVPTDVAVAALLQGMTAHYLAHDSYPIQPGDRVLVHAAAGGVGNLLVQLAKLRGGYVIATASSDEKRALAREAGADEVLSYQEAAEQAGELDVAAVYDGVGRTTFAAGLDALRPTGRMILYGGASGEPDPLDARLLAAKGSLYLQRPTLATYTRTPELHRERAAALFELLAAGLLHVRIGARYPLAEARRAHEDLEARRTVGKLLLVP
ncbi:MAG TPA: quinone oxidoreductase [Gaiellaceae bacterium]|jgi:NADPH2:quinone reductase|nr:quinone oxidoreductase [Gaiellaceae bacterium]